MTSIEVEPDVALLEGGEDVSRAGHVGALGVLAVGVGQVGNQVGERIGFDDRNDTDGGVGRDGGGDGIDVGLVVGHTVVRNGVFTVGSLGMAITVGEIVDDDLDDGLGALRLSIGKVGRAGG